MIKCIAFHGEPAIFSAIDADSRLWQNKVDEWDRKGTTFTTPYGVYRVHCMPCEVRDTSSTFQRTVHIMLSTVKCKLDCILLDVIVNLSKAPQGHFSDVRTVLPLLCNAGGTLELINCQCFTKSIDYRGQDIRPRRLEHCITYGGRYTQIESPNEQHQTLIYLGII